MLVFDSQATFFLPNRWTFKCRESQGLKPNKMLYKLLSHVDFNGEIMPRKLMEPAPGTTTPVIYPPLYTSKQKHMSAKMSLCKPKRKIKLPSCMAGFLCEYYALLLYWRAIFVFTWLQNHTHTAQYLILARMCLFLEYIPPGSTAVLFSKGQHPKNQVHLRISLSERSVLFVFVVLFPVEELVQNL